MAPKRLSRYCQIEVGREREIIGRQFLKSRIKLIHRDAFYSIGNRIPDHFNTIDEDLFIDGEIVIMDIKRQLKYSFLSGQCIYLFPCFFPDI